MRFRSYDSLRLFDVVARHHSFTSAANALNLSKGAVSYRINRLERELGFLLFARRHRTIALTEKGRQLLEASQAAFRDLEGEITRLRGEDVEPITIGMSTYFASRWLSPRLMTFIADHPGTTLRLQPLVDLIDIETENIDMAIRWGKGQWSDLEIEPLFRCPAFITAGVELARRVAAQGLQEALANQTLLQDRKGSEAWLDWHRAAGLPYRPSRDTLVIADPNVRVQAVINGQGVALNDALVELEIAAGNLYKISDVELSEYGYFLAFPDRARENSSLRAFRDWIVGQANAPGDGDVAAGSGSTSKLRDH